MRSAFQLGNLVCNKIKRCKKVHLPIHAESNDFFFLIDKQHLMIIIIIIIIINKHKVVVENI